MRLKLKLFVVCVFILLITHLISLSCIASDGKWIIKYRVENLKTRQLVLEKDFQTGVNNTYFQIFAGDEYNITITINIPVTVSYAILTLATNLERASSLDRYWELRSESYPVVDYNPSQTHIKFSQVKGTFTVSLYGKVPTGITEQKISGIVLHRPVKYVSVELKGPNNELLDSIVLDVIDAKIDEYQNLLRQKEDALQEFKKSGVARGYIKLFENVINQAKINAGQGFVDIAINLLNQLTLEEPPKEHVPSLVENLFIPTVAGLSAVTIGIGIMLLRVRGKLSYVLHVVEDQIKDLEGLILRASKIDKTISLSLENINNKLKSLVGV